MACILESAEIKKLWPVFNYSQKRWEDVYGIFSYEDQNGFLRLAIEKNKKHLAPLYRFHYLVDGHTILRKLIKDFRFCPRLCFMQKDSIACEGMKEGHCDGACCKQESTTKYNHKVQKAIQFLQAQPSFAIIEKGLNGDDQSCVLVCEGKFYGMGYIPADMQITDPEQLKDLVTPYRENIVIRNLVNGYAARFPGKVRLFSAQAV
jgi:DNA polymerase-3 subunit epsilon